MTVWDASAVNTLPESRRAPAAGVVIPLRGNTRMVRRLTGMAKVENFIHGRSGYGDLQLRVRL